MVSSPLTCIYSHLVFAFNLFAVQWPIQTDFFPHGLFVLYEKSVSVNVLIDNRCHELNTSISLKLA